MFPIRHSVVLALMVTSCQASAPASLHNSADGEQLSEYNAQNRVLFDDELGGVTLNGALAEVEVGQASLLSRRILEASTVVVCQIQTITEERAGESTRARIEFRGRGQSLSSAVRDECPVISVASQSYSFLLIHHSGNALIGKNVVLFLKQFNESGAAALHWHGEPDTPRIRDEVTRIGSPLH